ncbi:MAG: hypothetical protein IKH27_10455 [Oscillospiraceae bacterium]|nr:hypothetical protein [Oscillospiraceae bacterium]
MKRLVCKMIFITAVFIGVNCGLGGYAALCGAEPYVPWNIGLPVLLILLLLAGDLSDVLFPQDTVRHQKIFRLCKNVLFWLTAVFWLILLVPGALSVAIRIAVIAAAVLLRSIVQLIKKPGIRKQFLAYLQGQGIPAENLCNDNIRLSLVRLLRGKPGWVIEAEFKDAPNGIRRYGYRKNVFYPEN